MKSAKLTQSIKYVIDKMNARQEAHQGQKINFAFLI